MIGIIDYGCNNLYAVKNILDSLHIKNLIIENGNQSNLVEKYILPGVSSFDASMKNLAKFNNWEQIVEDIKIKKKYILGICVGMQLLGSNSEEGIENGLNFIKKKVYRFEEKDHLPIPHMGWNTISFSKQSKLLNGLDENSHFYFCHSYCFKNISEDCAVAYTNYVNNFCSVINSENIFGVQFHPEKSHKNGEIIFQNFQAL